MNHLHNQAALLLLYGAAMIPAGNCRAAAGKKPAKAEKPNFIIIMADDMGYGDIGCFGNNQTKTPVLDQMAASGIKLTDYHSNGAVSTPTRAALVTGRYQQRAGLQGVHLPWKEETRNIGLQEGEVTFGKVMSDNGYKVALFGKWHLGTADYASPNRRGFPLFTGYRGANIDYVNHRDATGADDWWLNMELHPEAGYATDLIAQHTADFIRENSSAPFCIYVAHAVPHYPYQAPGDPEFRMPGKGMQHQAPRKDKDNAYREMIERLDKTTGDILAALKQTGLDRKTIIFFVSDNGPVGSGQTGGLNGRKASLLEGGHRVPGIVYAPGQLPSGVVCNQTVMSMDIFPTMLDFAGIKYNDSKKPLDGTSIATILRKGTPLPHRSLFWRSSNQVAIRNGDWKMICYRGGKDKGKTVLYNLNDDLYETTDLSAAHPDTVARLKAEIAAWEKSIDSEVPEQID